MEPLFSPDEYVFYEHSFIPLGVFYIEDDGRFRAYLVSDGVCRMYDATREEMLDRLNGDDPFVNIPEKEEMYKAVKAFSHYDDQYNVVFHEYVGKDRKLITIHGIGRHEYTRDGRRYSIIRYDEISDKSRRYLFRDEEKEIEDKQRLLYDIDDAIARSYTSVVYIDTADKTVHEVRLNKNAREFMRGISEESTLREMMDLYVNTVVFRDDAAGLLKFGDYEYVINMLKDTNPIYHTYRTISDGKIVYYRLKILPIEGGKKLVYGFEHFDDQIREQLARKTEQETQMTLLAGLSCEYESVWLVDAAIHHARNIRNNMKPSAHSEATHADKEGSYDTILGNYIDRYVVPEDRERMYLEGSIDNLMRNTKEDEIYHINYARINTEGDRNYLQLSVARVTDQSGFVRFVCGFRNIDAIIEEEKNRTLLFSMAHMDHMTKLNNRRTFDEYMDTHANEKVAPDLVFMSFDVNELKEANDNHGHEAGDELIIGAANCMKDVIGSYGELYRTGGDEFAAILSVPPGKLEELTEELKSRFANHKSSAYSEISISIGCVTATENGIVSIDDMRREAEKRMYAQKTDHYMKEGHDRRRNRKH